MGKYSNILGGGGNDQRKKFFETPLEGIGPVPHGKYRCRVTKGENWQSAKGTDGYRLTFEVIEGELTGRKFWKTYYFTEAALAYSRVELAKFGIVEEHHCMEPFPGDKAIQCTVFVIVSASERGEQNDVARITDIIIQGTSDGMPSKTSHAKPAKTKGTTAQKRPANQNPSRTKSKDRKRGDK
ncbi:hypothetical protein [Zavarzinella formosa]|uniref:hypothetical protein n=1 Tax=Zavarzinella formosa TaxID=360055 RepID=UPI0002F03836|nr:hypothetical protein [Zavarzinella formosa]